MGSKKKRTNDIYFKSRNQTKKRQQTIDEQQIEKSGLQAIKAMVSTGVAAEQISLLFDVTWLFIVYFGIIYRNHVHSEWWYDIQMGKLYPGWYDHFFIIMRCINDRLQLPDNRPLYQRLFFVLLRNSLPLIYGNVLFQHGFKLDFIFNLCITMSFAVLYTVLLTFIRKANLLKFKELILIGQAEQACVFTQMIIVSMNRVHDPEYADGDLITAFIIMQCIIHIRQGSIYLEELLLGGVNGFNMGSVPSNYFSHYSAFAALYFFVSTSLDFPIELVIPSHEKCQVGLWNRVVDSECRVRINGWQRALDYINPQDIIVYDAVTIGIMVWFYYGAVNYIRSLRETSQVKHIKYTKIKSD